MIFLALNNKPMGHSKKKNHKKLSHQLRSDILDIFADNPNKQLNYKQIASLLEVHDPANSQTDL